LHTDDCATLFVELIEAYANRAKQFVSQCFCEALYGDTLHVFLEWGTI
jgi:hypothetical protein